MAGNVAIILDSQEQPFVNRLYDLMHQVQRDDTPQFSTFLNEREQAIALSLVPSFECKGELWGGFDKAQRKILALYPEYWSSIALTDFPIVALQVVHLPTEILGHRDVLGSLIGLGITRESIGDILPQQGVCNFLVSEPVAPVILENLKRIGRTGVRCQPSHDTLVAVQEYHKKYGTVSSNRIDCLVSMLTGLSRDKSANLIRREQVQMNYLVEDKLTIPFQPEDIITIRGYGKYIVDIIGSPTRKNRLPVECRQYK